MLGQRHLGSRHLAALWTSWASYVSDVLYLFQTLGTKHLGTWRNEAIFLDFFIIITILKSQNVINVYLHTQYNENNYLYQALHVNISLNIRIIHNNYIFSQRKMIALQTLIKPFMMFKVQFNLNSDYSSHENNSLDGINNLTQIIPLKNFQQCERLFSLNPECTSYDHTSMVG